MSADENVFPYILLLPIDPKKQEAILKNVFGSDVGLKIFRKLGTDPSIFQKNIISSEALEGHSNKTILRYLKRFEELHLLKSEYKEINGRRLKQWTTTDVGKWIVILLKYHEMPKSSIKNAFEDLFRLYSHNALQLALEKGFELEQLHDIFHKTVAKLSLQLIQIPKITPEVVVFGSAAMDLLIRAELPELDELVVSEDMHRLPGGSAANVAVALSKLGIQTSFVGKLGGDFNSLLLIKEFLREGVDISNLKIDMNKKAPEVIIINSNDEKRIIAPYGEDIAVSLESPEEIDWGLLESAKVIYIGELFREVAAVVSSYGHNFNKLVVYRPSTAYMKAGIESIAPILKNTDILITNRRGWELLQSSSKATLTVPTELLGYGGTTIIITQGAKGSEIYQHEKEFTVPAKKVEVLDTTGAGDAFAAGLIKGLLEDMNLQDATRFASKFASHATTKIGARSAYSTFSP